MTRPVVVPRTTGATEDQIEQSAINTFTLAYNKSPVEWNLVDNKVRAEFRKMARTDARLLVDVDHRIVAVADLKRLRSLWRTRSFPDTTEEVDVWLDGIDALIGGDA